jgi:hypothetical protein
MGITGTAISVTGTAAQGISSTAADYATPTAKAPQEVFYIWVPYSADLAASMMYAAVPTAVTWAAAGVSGTASAVTGTAMGVSGTASGVTGTAIGVTGTAIAVTGTATGVTGTATGVTGTSSDGSQAGETPTGLSITAKDGGTVL